MVATSSAPTPYEYQSSSNDAAAGLLDRLDQGGSIQRAQGAHVNNFNRDALVLFEPPRDFQRHNGHARIPHQGEIRTFLHDRGSPDWDGVVVLGVAVGRT